ncbi:MAG: hypothetical protein XD74_0550 [Actinobacteria bacterium 66_15]|nr:MAG: hypothetical protein XD74_0550 [Actinobacteria bacterium 66_15]
MMGGWGYGYDSMMNVGWLGGLLILLFGVLIIAGIAVLVVWALRQSSNRSAGGGSAPPPSATGQDEAVAIAKRRLASGEISKEEYEDLLKTLG